MSEMDSPYAFLFGWPWDLNWIPWQELLIFGALVCGYEAVKFWIRRCRS